MLPLGPFDARQEGDPSGDLSVEHPDRLVLKIICASYAEFLMREICRLNY
jgi:hypothetical protein